MKKSIAAVGLFLGALAAQASYIYKDKDGHEWELDPPLADGVDTQSAYFNQPDVTEVFDDSPITDEWFRFTVFKVKSAGNPQVGHLRFYTADGESIANEQMSLMEAVTGTGQDGKPTYRAYSELLSNQVMPAYFGDSPVSGDFGYYKCNGWDGVFVWTEAADCAYLSRWRGDWDKTAYGETALAVGSTTAMIPLRQAGCVWRMPHTAILNRKGVSSYILRRRFSKGNPVDYNPDYEPTDWMLESSPDGKKWYVIDFRKNVPHTEPTSAADKANYAAALYNGGKRMGVRKLVKVRINVPSGEVSLRSVCPASCIYASDSGVEIEKTGAGTLVIDEDIANPVVAKAGKVRFAAPSCRFDRFRLTVTDTKANSTVHFGSIGFFSDGGARSFADSGTSVFDNNSPAWLAPSALQRGEIEPWQGYSGSSLKYFFNYAETITGNATVMLNKYIYDDPVEGRKTVSLAVDNGTQQPDEARRGVLQFRLPYGATQRHGASSYNLTSFVLTNGGVLDNQPTDWRLEGSADGEVWTLLSTEQGHAAPSARSTPYADGPFALTSTSALVPQSYAGKIAADGGTVELANAAVESVALDDMTFTDDFNKTGPGRTVCYGATVFNGAVNVRAGTLSFSSRVCTNEWYRYTGTRTMNTGSTCWIGNMQFCDANAAPVCNDAMTAVANVKTSDPLVYRAFSELSPGEIMGGYYGNPEDPDNFCYYGGAYLGNLLRVGSGATADDMAYINRVYGRWGGEDFGSSTGPALADTSKPEPRRQAQVVFRLPTAAAAATRGVKTYRIRTRYCPAKSTTENELKAQVCQWTFETSADGVNWVPCSTVDMATPPSTTNTWYAETFAMVSDGNVVPGPGTSVEFNGAVSVAPGATLDLSALGAAPEVSRLDVDMAGAGRVAGTVAFATTGELHLTNLVGDLKGQVIPLQIDRAVGSLSNWKVYVDGKPVRACPHYSPDTGLITLSGLGLMIILR